MTRITAGRYRGRILQTPKAGTVTRPTGEKVRAALANSLQAAGGLAGATVLDLFAGTGALGLELVSRGAARAVLVESDRGALALLRANVEALGAPATVVAGAVAGYLAASRGPFDVVVADPPYDYPGADLTGVLAALVTGGSLVTGADVVVERSVRSGEIDWPAGLTPVRSKRYGDTVLHYAAAEPPRLITGTEQAG